VQQFSDEDSCLDSQAYVTVTLARPLHVSKVGQSKEKGKTKQATVISDLHAHVPLATPTRKPWSLSDINQ